MGWIYLLDDVSPSIFLVVPGSEVIRVQDTDECTAAEPA